MLVREEAEQMIGRMLTNNHVLLVGAETGSNAVNHSVAYIFEQGTGKIMKLHGGITQLAKWEGEYVAKATLESTVGRMNTMQVFNLAKSPAEVMAWWQKMAGSNAFTSFMRAGIPRGCATGTSVLILEQLAKEGAITGVPIIRGASRWMPLYLDRTLGSYVLNPMNVWRGTLTQGAMAATAPIVMHKLTGYIAGQGQPQSYQFDWSDWVPGGGVSTRRSPASTRIPA